MDLRSDLGWSTAATIYLRGVDLMTLMGHADLGQVAFLQLLGRRPDASESVLMNAMLVALVEHGPTPSALASRLTLMGAPESLQGAVAAGLLGLGDRFGGSVEGAARLLQTAEPGDPTSLADAIVTDHRSRGLPIPGVGHPVHKKGDPRASRLRELAVEHERCGRHAELMFSLPAAVEQATGRRLPVNVTGAIAAVASDLGIPWQACRGLAVMARAVGLVGHVLEELSAPVAGEIWRRTDAEITSAHLPEVQGG